MPRQTGPGRTSNIGAARIGVSPAALRELSAAVPLFAALGDGTRLGLLLVLADGQPRSISQLGKGRSLTRQALTKHLLVLAQAGLLRSSRAGREHLWEMERDGLLEAQRYLDLVSSQWDGALARLKAQVEG